VTKWLSIFLSIYFYLKDKRI